MDTFIHTYIENYKKWEKTYYFYIFDTGERLIISFIPTDKIDLLVDIIKKLYSIIDVEIDQIYNNKNSLNDNTVYFINNNINCLFQEDDYKSININKLKANILTIIEYENLIKKSNKCKTLDHNLDWYNKCFEKPKEVKPYSIDNIEPYDDTLRYRHIDLNKDEIFNTMQVYTDIIYNSTNRLVVLFNSIYNISVVVEEQFLNIKPEEFCSIFNEWKIINIIQNDEKYLKDLKDKFHIKTFESHDIITKKLKIFIDYYEINIEQVSTSIYKQNKVDYNVVKNVILSKYTINNNEENRIKSQLLIDEIMNLLNMSNYVCSKSVLPGLFLECGLKKKRYSDGIYYYGLKENIDVT